MASRKEFIVENHSTTVLSKLNEQRLEGSFCDVILQVESKKFHAHQSVLSACSEYFRKMFTTNMKEKYDGVVTFGDITLDALDSLINFLYTQKIVLTEDNVSDLLYAASIMQIEDALNVIISYLSDMLNTENCLYFRQLGNLHSLPKLIAETDQYILDHFEEISQQDAFLDLDFNEIDMLLASDNVKVTKEKWMYEVLIRWTNKDLEKRKKGFLKLFSNLRLQYVTFEFLANVICKEKLVRDFPESRDLTDSAWFFHAQPGVIEAEEPRIGYKKEPDSLICVTPGSMSIFNVLSNTLNNNATLDGWALNLIALKSALAANFPKAVFCGGVSSKNEVCNKVVQFDGTRWRMLQPMNVARAGAAAVFHKGKLYVFGGEKVNIAQIYSNNTDNPHSIDDFADDYEIFVENWNSEGKLQNRRSFAAAESLDCSIYFIGGYLRNNTIPPRRRGVYGGYIIESVRCKEVCNTTDIFDVGTRTWKDGPLLNTARANFASASAKSTIYIFGGVGVNGQSLKTAEFLSEDGQVWTRLASSCPWNMSETHACLQKDQIYLVSINENAILRFDPEAQKFKEIVAKRIAGSYVIGYASEIR